MVWLESQTHGVGGVARGLIGHLVPIPLPWTGTLLPWVTRELETVHTVSLNLF